MNKAVADITGDQLTTATARLTSCHEEIHRLRGMKRRRAWTRGRVNWELRLLLPLLRVRERIPDAFWRTFVLVIGTSIFVAVSFLVTRNSSFTATSVGITAAITATTFTLLVLVPSDGLLDRRRLTLSQVAASADHEHQNLCSQLQFLMLRRDTVASQLKLLRQQADPLLDLPHDLAATGPSAAEPVDDSIYVDSNDAPRPTEQEAPS